MTKRIVIFDFDGLLVDTEPLFFRAIKTVLEKEGIEIKEHDYIETDVQNGISLIDTVQHENHHLDAEFIKQNIYDEYGKLLRSISKRRLFLPGAIELVKQLENHYLLAIASSSKREYVESILKDAKLRDSFSVLICREDVGNLKPAPDPFIEVARRLNVPPDQCLVIEDSQRGLIAAKAAGMRCIIVPNRFTLGYDYKDAERVVSSLREINIRLIDKVFGEIPQLFRAGQYLYVAIAAFLPYELAQRIAEVSQQCAEKYGSWYVLDTIRFPPHVTLWIAYIPTKNINKLHEEVSRIISSQHLHCEIDIIGKHISKDGHIAYGVRKSRNLQDLHFTLLRKLNKWREGYLHPKYADNLENYPEDQQESLRKYGTRFAGKLFSPHITVASIGTDYVNEAEKLIPDIKGSFKVNELVLFRQLEQGKSIQVINRFPLHK